MNKGIDDALVAGQATRLVSPEEVMDKRSPLEFPPSDSGNAELIAELFGDRIRYVSDKGFFYWWDGRRGKKDEKEVEVGRCATEAARERQQAATTAPDKDTRKTQFNWGLRSESAHGNRSAVYMLRQVPGIAVPSATFDRDEMLLNCPNGTVNLRTGKLQPHRREDYLTRIVSVPFDPGAGCPLSRPMASA